MSKPNWHKQVNVNTKRMNQLMRDIRNDVSRRTKNSKDLDAWMENLAPYIANNPFITGTHAEAAKELSNMIADTVNRTSLPAGSNAELMRGTIAEATMTMVTNVGEDIKTSLRQIALESYNNKNTPQKTAKLMESKIDSFNRTRCQAIARTETMRAGNCANYLNAREDGMQSYTVDCDDGACEYCVELYREGETVDSDESRFSIDDYEHLPPFHPNCRCVPLFWPEPLETEDAGDTEETTTEETEEITNTDGNIFDNPKITEITDDLTGRPVTKYEYENGTEIHMFKNSTLSYDDVINHFKTLPSIIRENKAIIKISDTNTKQMDGICYAGKPPVIVVYENGRDKQTRLDTLTHELAHGIDNKIINGKKEYILSKIEIYERIVKEDNKLYAYTRPNGKKRTPWKFVTDYAGKSWVKFKKNKDTKHKKYCEDFAESVKLYLNNNTHDEFVKNFPNRAKYLKEVLNV